MVAKRSAEATVIDYRVAAVEKAIERVGANLEAIDKNLGTLTSLAAEQKNANEALARAFGRVEAVERAQASLDGEYRKWFNRGVGVASVCSVLWLVGGGYIAWKLREVDAAISSVPYMQAELRRRQKIDMFILRRLGIEDVVEHLVDQ